MNVFFVKAEMGTGRIVWAGHTQASAVDGRDDYLVTDVLVDPQTNRVANGEIVPLPAKPDGYTEFNYSTLAWEDPRTLTDHKMEKWAEIKQARDTFEYGGFAWDGSMFDSDAISQQRIQGLLQIAGLDPDMSIQWTLADNTTRTLSAADALNVGKSLASHVNEVHMAARIKREAIEASTTREQVQAITWP